MKKWFIMFLVFTLILVGIYVIIPPEFDFNHTVKIDATQHQAERELSQLKSWQLITNKNHTNNHIASDDSSFEVENTVFRFLNPAYGRFFFDIGNSSAPTSAVMQLLPRNDSTVWLNMKFTYYIGLNPFTRIQHYLKAKSVAQKSRKLMVLASEYLGMTERETKSEIAYGSVIDTAYISMQFTPAQYPSTSEIYKRVDSIRSFAKTRGVIVTGDPMLHVRILETGQYFAMVALPVNQPIASTGRFILKKMFRGKLLVYEVKGGIHTTRKAFQTLEDFVDDHQLQSPAIPYISLVTDRMNEPDTSKWVSRICYPVY